MPGTGPSQSSRYVLPQNLETAIRQLSEAELDKLVEVALEERARRRKPEVPKQSERKRDLEEPTASLPLGKLNAVRAAFQAGITPNKIAREFGLSRSEVKSALSGHTRGR
jgi:DNA invertase Pin-like site-specific DNA recombinase